MLSFAEMRRYHFIGVGGSGMSALAALMRRRGAEVSGSDRLLDRGRMTSRLERLQAAGVTFHPQDGTGVREGVDVVVTGSAVEQDNADLAAAHREGIPVLHRMDLIAELTRGQDLVAVAGTSGKSTVTTMIGYVLERAGLDPWVLGGAEVSAWMGDAAPGNMRVGSGSIWVVEADESDRSLLRLDPQRGVITSIARDHFGLGETVEIFREFGARIRRVLVTGVGVAELVAEACGTEVVIHEVEPASKRDGVWRVPFGEGEVCVGMPGRYNAENAALAALMCRTFGVREQIIREALETFPGVHRRMESIGAAGGVRVYDDYAHNPQKIRSAWETAAEMGRVLGVWRPHGYRPLAFMFDDLVEAFSDVVRREDRLVVLPVYYAGGSVEKVVDSPALVKALNARGIAAHYCAEAGKIPALLVDDAREGDVVLVMGARDPGLPDLARGLLKYLEARRPRG